MGLTVSANILEFSGGGDEEVDFLAELPAQEQLLGFPCFPELLRDRVASIKRQPWLGGHT